MKQAKRTDLTDHTDSRDLLVKDVRIWDGQEFGQGSILIRQGKIAKIARRILVSATETVKARGIIAIPGLVDVHVHLRGLGLAYKEDFETGTAAAAAGGFTSVIDMPNTQPPTDSVVRLEEKMEQAAPRILVNVGFHAAAVGNHEAAWKMSKAGAFSLKLYLPKPISSMAIDDKGITRLMRTAAKTRLPITVHAEDQRILSESRLGETGSFSVLAEKRPQMAETIAISRILRLRKGTRAAVHFCHVTLSSSVAEINRARSKRLSSEVTPHHLLLSNHILSQLGWKAWMVPPLRPDRERRKLLADAAEGRVSVAASDHAPHTVEEKMLPAWMCPPGIPGLETTLRLLLTLVNKGKFSMGRLVELLSTNPARLFGLHSRGKLEEGADGDLVLVDLKKRSKIRAEHFFSKAKYTPFEGLRTQGVVHATIVGGRIVYANDEIVAKPGSGRVLRRKI